MNRSLQDMQVESLETAPQTAGRGHYGICPQAAEAFQKDVELTTACIWKSPEISGAEKCLLVKRATDGLLIHELGRALADVVPCMPSLSNPPRTKQDVFHLLVIEMFLRFQEKEKRDEGEHGRT